MAAPRRPKLTAEEVLSEVLDSTERAIHVIADASAATVIGSVAIDQTTDGTTNKVNTELPAARLYADNLAYPTAPDVLAWLMADDGATGDKLKAVSGYLGVSMSSVAASLVATISGPALLLDTTGSARPLCVTPFLRDSNTGVHVQHGNIELSLLASASRAVTTNSADVNNKNARGIAVIINVTVEAAGETLSLKIQGKEVVSSNYYDIVDAGVIYTAATEAPTLTKALIVYPGILAADLVGIGAGINGSIAKSSALPPIWRAVVTHSAVGNWTYSVSYALLV